MKCCVFWSFYQSGLGWLVGSGQFDYRFAKEVIVFLPDSLLLNGVSDGRGGLNGFDIDIPRLRSLFVIRVVIYPRL